MKIRILVTGGTIDKEYNELTGELLFSESKVSGMLMQARSKVGTVLEVITLIDSLDMTEADRQKILQACKASKENRIVITHGTDTMVETAQLLGKKLENKTIVLLGAMVPYTFGSSDALFNLGCAMAAVQILDPGIYITMNGKIFPWNKVQKNKEAGEFEEV